MKISVQCLICLNWVYYFFFFFFFTFDFISGYHHVAIFSWSQAIPWVFMGPSFQASKLKYFVFAVLPFGLTSAPYIFIKLMRPLVRHWRSTGRRIVVFLDDGIGGSGDFDAAQEFSISCRSVLASAGLYVNDLKSKQSISRVLNQRDCSAKELASIAGQLISMFLAIGNLVRLLSRDMYAQVQSQQILV